MQRGTAAAPQRLRLRAGRLGARAPHQRLSPAPELCRRTQCDGLGWRERRRSRCKPRSPLCSNEAQASEGAARAARRAARLRAHLGSVVLLAVGFVAQDAIDLVYDGRRQLWKDLSRRSAVGRQDRAPAARGGCGGGRHVAVPCSLPPPPPRCSQPWLAG